MRTQTEAFEQTRYNEWICLALLIFTIIITPSDWEKVEFMLLLFIPIVLSTNYFHLDSDILKKGLLCLAVFISASVSSLALHLWQLNWEIDNPDGLFGWQMKIDPLLYSIPFNDGMWLRQFSTPFLDDIFVTIYIHGFVLCLFGLAVYFLLTGRPEKIIHAMLAGHFLQYLLILPFHFWLDGHQTWFIQNQNDGTLFMDPLAGYRTEMPPIIPSLNHVFPSMHTSIAFVVILIALREKSKPIKYFFVTMNIGIIISTVYLGIHWIVDVIGGLLFGYMVFKLADKIMASEWLKQLLDVFIYDGKRDIARHGRIQEQMRHAVTGDMRNE